MIASLSRERGAVYSEGPFSIHLLDGDFPCDFSAELVGRYLCLRLSSVSPATVYAGGPAFTLQVTGSGFTSASTVLINGNSRTTAYVSGTSLTAQVLASDIAQTGQLNVQVTTPAPGGGTSNYVGVSIAPPPQTAPAVTVTPSTTSLTTAQALTVTVAVGGGTGNPTPTGSVMLAAGSNYSGTMNISCTLASSPTGAVSLPTCSLNPTTLNIVAGGTASTVLTVQTTAASTSAPLAPARLRLFDLGSGGAILAGLLLIGIPARRRRWMAMMLLLWIVVAAGAMGCGGGGGSSSGSGGSSISATTAGAYRFAVTGTDSANSSMTTSSSVTVTVQ
jgi:hypothetical protein